MWERSLDLSDTIFARTTGSLPSAIAIEKLSGPRAFEIGSKIFLTKQGKPLSKKRGLQLGTLSDESGKKIDEVLALVFVAPGSYSGENTIEFHCHGSPAIIRRLEQVLVHFGASPARKGEFSYRAFLNGKLSILELQTLGDLYHSRDVADLHRIYERRDGSLQIIITNLKKELIGLQAIFDTAVDFSEEYSSVLSRARKPIAKVIHGCSEIIQRYASFQSGSDHSRLVLAGRPNAGKSSLFNALLCRYRAIVHEEPGTTLDVIEEDIEVGGNLWKVVDTAGIREETLGVEKEGVLMGNDFLASASYWILVVDGTMGLGSEDLDLLLRFGEKGHLVVWNKRDLAGWRNPPSINGSSVLAVSAKTGESLIRLWEKLKCEMMALNEGGVGPLPTAVESARLSTVKEQMEEIERSLAGEIPPEYLAEKNRRIIQALDVVMGEVDPEEVWETIFRDFCIGK